MIRTIILTLVLLIVIQKANAGSVIVNVGFFGDSESEEFNGVKLGLSEAKHQGRFVGVSYNLLVNPVKNKNSHIDSMNAIVTNLKDAELRLLIERFAYLPIINLSDDSNSLRRECISNTFHINPSRAMLDDAKILATEDGQLQAWQHSFKKYAAIQLNNRFFAKYNRRMSENAWFGWVGMKIISETTMRTRKPTDLTRDLKGNIKFDGQKGRKLSFRYNGQLRQPIFIVKNGEVVEEIPTHSNNEYGGLDMIGENKCHD